MAPYIEVPLERLADELNGLLLAARNGSRIVIMHEGEPYAQIKSVNSLMTEKAHQALEDLATFPAIQHPTYESWWAAVKPVHE
ncbi:hypothetical protein [Achromobacter anxifer]